MEIQDDSVNLDELKEALLTHICNQDRAFIKSQQIDEPELKFDEKLEIVTNLLNDSHLKFLHRFGSHLRRDHLKYFDCPNNSEITESLKIIRHDMDHQNVRVKNRRYAAMLKMLQDDDYFSIDEMRHRDPLLYEQYVGQYETPEEKRANLRPNAETDTLVDILLKGIEKKHNEEVEEQQRKDENESNRLSGDDEDDTEDSSQHSRPPKETQWGNFDDENPATSQPASNSRKRHAKSIAENEKNLLRKEFCSIMYQNFLSGRDSEHFDYSRVDENDEYDNVSENDHDEEDKYFEDDNDEPDDEPESILNQHPINIDEDEDDLDIYMKHLKNNMKSQQQSGKFVDEEFDDDD